MLLLLLSHSSLLLFGDVVVYDCVAIAMVTAVVVVVLVEVVCLVYGVCDSLLWIIRWRFNISRLGSNSNRLCKHSRIYGHSCKIKKLKWNFKTKKD